MEDNARPYVKLGGKASGFFAPYSRFKVSKGEIKQLPLTYTRDAAIMTGIAGGHLVYASDVEVNAYKSQAVGTKDIEGLSEAKEEINNLTIALDEKQKEIDGLLETLSEKDKAIELYSNGKENIFKFNEEDLVKYITESYELEKDELKKFKKMSFPEKKAYAYDLEKNSVIE